MAPNSGCRAHSVVEPLSPHSSYNPLNTPSSDSSPTTLANHPLEPLAPLTPRSASTRAFSFCLLSSPTTLCRSSEAFSQAASSRPRRCFHVPALGGKSLRGSAAPPSISEEIAFTRPVGCGGVVASLKGVVWSMMGGRCCDVASE